MDLEAGPRNPVEDQHVLALDIIILDQFVCMMSWQHRKGTVGKVAYLVHRTRPNLQKQKKHVFGKYIGRLSVKIGANRSCTDCIMVELSVVHMPRESWYITDMGYIKLRD
jgi:hypothetical protein